MPGGQYTNLFEQAQAMGLGAKWREVIKAYALANKLFGDIIKVTPSSKVVGDMALFITANGLDENNFYEKAASLSFPASVVGMMNGDLGFPPGGFPKQLQKLVLGDHAPKRSRQGRSIVFERVQDELDKKLNHNRKKSPVKISETDVLSYIMAPQSAMEFLNHRKEYGDTSVLPTLAFFFGMQPGEEIAVELEEGKTLYIKLSAVSETDTTGMKTLFFELNGSPRDIKVQDKGKAAVLPKRPKAEPENLHHVGATMPGSVVDVLVKPGDTVQKGDKLFLLEAMKMETSVTAPRPGVVGTVLVAPGDKISAGDLILTYQ